MMSHELPSRLSDLPTQAQIFESFRRKYSKYAPEFELEAKSFQVAKLNELALERQAVILKHNYMTWDLQSDEVIGIRGDSLELARKAAETNAKVFQMEGVRFMADTVFVLNPNATVLIPSLKAGCSLASSMEPENVLWLREQAPGSPVVMYVNTDARTKAVTDVCCASGNATKVVHWALENLDPYHTRKVIFGPDQFLATNVAEELGAEIYFPSTGLLIPAKNPSVDFKIIGWHGQCEVHNKFTEEDIDNLQKEFPGIYIMSHPEVNEKVYRRSNFGGSTGNMLRKLADPEIQKRQVAILSECGLQEAAAEIHPNILQICSIQKRCPHMATNDLETAIESLEKMQYQVTIPEETRAAAEIPIRRMIAIK